MQRSVFNCATIRVANTDSISGRATADEMRGPRFHNCTIKVCALVAATLLLPALAYAQNNQGDNQIAALQAQINALQRTVTALQTQLAAVQSNKALGLGPFVSVVSGLVDGVNGPHIYFTGANLHIVSGSTTTADSVTGLGNLIIGYNEVPIGLSPGDRGGAHNLVIGRENRFTQAAFGGLVAGEMNTISNEGASVICGDGNTASGRLASVTGGENNTASGQWASVTGGGVNTAKGQQASVAGGGFNTANGGNASVTGGVANTASGVEASVSGGFSNTASGEDSVVIGGQGVTANNRFSIAPQPPFP
jgi:trimeric autotransporter adhesin